MALIFQILQRNLLAGAQRMIVLQGKAVYRLNRDWVEVGPGDYMWLRAFCPQACYAGGPWLRMMRP